VIDDGVGVAANGGGVAPSGGGVAANGGGVPANGGGVAANGGGVPANSAGVRGGAAAQTELTEPPPSSGAEGGRFHPVGVTGATGGHGLAGLAERARLLNGAIEAGALAGGGYRLAVTVPVAHA
jgi:hypothetical protein